MDRAVQIALQEAAAQGISGKRLTPFLLSRVAQLDRRRQYEGKCIAAGKQCANCGALCARDRARSEIGEMKSDGLALLCSFVHVFAVIFAG